MSAALKEKTRRAASFSKKVDVSLPQGNRFSPFGRAVSDGKALRELEGEAFVDRWLNSERGTLFLIGRWFAKVETEFMAIREAAALDPNATYPGDFYDETMLNIHRRQKAAELMRRAWPEYHEIIIERSKMECPLPPLSKRPLTALESKIEVRLAAMV